MKNLLIPTFLILAIGCATTYQDKRQLSPNFKDGKFHNTAANEVTANSGRLLEALGIYFSDQWSTWPDWIDSQLGPTPTSRVTANDITVTLINHATVLIQAHGINILTDPIFSMRASPFSFIGPKRVRQTGITFDSLPPIDVVVISHDHYDHLDLPTMNQLIERDNPQIYVGLGVGERFDSMQNITEMDWWQSIDVNENLTLSFVEVQHFSGRSLFDRASTLWGGFVLKLGGKKIYFGGDSGYADHYVKTQEKYGAMDIAFLPIGAYKPKSFFGPIHMDPQDAVQAHLDLKAKQSIAIHYGTFQLTAEAVDEPEKALVQERVKAGVTEDEFFTIEFGVPHVITQ